MKVHFLIQSCFINQKGLHVIPYDKAYFTTSETSPALFPYFPHFFISHHMMSITKTVKRNRFYGFNLHLIQLIQFLLEPYKLY